ncbi:MAG TPA: SRPBCC family protein [Gemmatimonadales bacterium]|nr:SRPBCC family protein [Gemmatimonadales bacterium]
MTTPSDREIVLTRGFDAPRKLVWEALTTPALLKRWLLGPPGWTMTTCELDLRVGGAYRYEWRKEDGTVMGMGGLLREVVAPERLIATERFDQSWYPGEGLVSQVLTEQGGRTTITMTLRYESKEARDMVVKSGATSGMELGYARLAELLAAAPAGSGR